MSICSLFLLLAAAIYGIGAVIARRSPDYREQQQLSDDFDPPESADEEQPAESANLPLLNEEDSSDQSQL